MLPPNPPRVCRDGRNYLRDLAVFILLAAFLYPSSLSLAPAASGASPATDELKLVVALFRHGVRSPSPDFKDVEADKHSKAKWPALTDWKVMPTPSPSSSPTECDKGDGWGYLTVHGQGLVQGLGVYYGKYYRRAWPTDFNVYLWADSENQRTRETANALKAGFIKGGVPTKSVTVASLLPACTADPLFHPFQRGCGTPDGAELATFATGINEEWLMWAMTTYDTPLQQLYSVLDCSNTKECSMPLKWVAGCAETCVAYSGACTAPLGWKGRFSYASSASEAFLLEYANNMDVGWGKIDPPNSRATSKLQEMLKLHEFYFDKTDRFLGDNRAANPDLASVGASNLVREILDQLERKAGNSTDGQCPRANADSDFVGLVGHDTNLAGVGALLQLEWQFDDPQLPADTRGLPASDALPAGALVFELRKRSDGSYSVRIEYVTQSLEQMRKGSGDQPFRLAVDGPDCVGKRPCEMPLNNFQTLVEKKIKRQFLSTCTGTPPEQSCGEPK